MLTPHALGPRLAAAAIACLLGAEAAAASAIREIEHNPAAVIQVAVARGVVTLLQLPDGDPLRFVAVGRAADCAKADDAWCVSAPADTTLIFAKAKSRASASNNLEVVTQAGRKYSFRLVVGDERSATQRLVVSTAARDARMLPGRVQQRALPAPIPPVPQPTAGPDLPVPALTNVLAAAPSLRDDPEVLARRLAAEPRVANGDYSLAIGDRSDDIVPTAVFDDGLFTYLRLPGNRDVPAVFHVMADGQETLVNTRMESELLIVDRVSRQLRLRVGNQVVSVFNDAFDVEGRTVTGTGTTVEGVERVVRAAARTPPDPGRISSSGGAVR